MLPPLLNFVTNPTSLVYFRHFYIDSYGQYKGSPPLIFNLPKNIKYFIVFINFYFILFVRI